MVEVQTHIMARDDNYETVTSWCEGPGIITRDYSKVDCKDCLRALEREKND